MQPCKLEAHFVCPSLHDLVNRHMTSLTAFSYPQGEHLALHQTDARLFTFLESMSFKAGEQPTLSGHPWAELASSLGMRLGTALPLRWCMCVCSLPSSTSLSCGGAMAEFLSNSSNAS